MKRKMLTTLALAATSLLALGGVIGVGAEPADAPQSATGGGWHCAVLFGASPAKGVPSPVLAQSCSTSRDDARAQLQAKAQPKSATAQQSFAAIPPLPGMTLLMTLFEDANYGGDSTDLYGWEGPCDSAGYEMHLETTWWWDWGNEVSSAGGTVECNRATFFNQEGDFAQSFDLPVRYIGPTLNDNVEKIQVWDNR